MMGFDFEETKNIEYQKFKNSGAFKALAEIVTAPDEPVKSAPGWLPIAKKRTLKEQTQSLEERNKLVYKDRERVIEDARIHEMNKPFELGGAL